MGQWFSANARAGLEPNSRPPPPALFSLTRAQHSLTFSGAIRATALLTSGPLPTLQQR